MDLYIRGDYSAALDTAHRFLQLESQNGGAAIPVGEKVQMRLMVGNIHLSYGNYARAMKH